MRRQARAYNVVMWPPEQITPKPDDGYVKQNSHLPVKNQPQIPASGVKVPKIPIFL